MKTLSIGANMKTLKTTLTIAALGLVTLLTGCATPNMQASFNRGDEVIYGRVFNVWSGKDMRLAHSTLCGSKMKGLKYESYHESVDKWLADNKFCSDSNLQNIQQVQVGIGIVNANGDRFNLVPFAPKDLKLEVGDIVAVQVFPGPDGRMRRPEHLVRIAAKAKDATKANGCYWDAGTGMLSGFNQGGAVCEGWHWKNHPFSNPSLLKK